MTSDEMAAAAAPPLFPDVTRDDVFRLETRRLWLRWPRVSDVAALADMAGRKEVAEMTGTWLHPLPQGEAERRVFEARKANATGRSLILALTARGKPNQLIGSIAVTPSREAGGAGRAELELGYMLHPAFWGQGLMAEAANALIDVAFRYTRAEAVEASVRVINPASRRVLQACGFAHLGGALRDLPARGGMQPVDLYRLTREDWLARQDWRAEDAAFGRGERDGSQAELRPRAAEPVD